MPAVWLEDHPDGMRVERTAVIDVRQDGDGWTVETLAGTEHVDERGEGRQLVPLDVEMAAEFEERGTSFVVRSTVDELVRDLEPSSYDWQRFEHDLGHDVDRGPEHDR
jgi:hypothetical protein